MVVDSGFHAETGGEAISAEDDLDFAEIDAGSSLEIGPSSEHVGAALGRTDAALDTARGDHEHHVFGRVPIGRDVD